MKCFTAQQSPYCCVGIGRDGLRTRKPSPEPPIADQNTGSNEVFLAAAVRLESGE